MIAFSSVSTFLVEGQTVELFVQRLEGNTDSQGYHIVTGGYLQHADCAFLAQPEFGTTLDIRPSELGGIFHVGGYYFFGTISMLPDLRSAFPNFTFDPGSLQSDQTGQILVTPQCGGGGGGGGFVRDEIQFIEGDAARWALTRGRSRYRITIPGIINPRNGGNSGTIQVYLMAGPLEQVQQGGGKVVANEEYPPLTAGWKYPSYTKVLQAHKAPRGRLSTALVVAEFQDGHYSVRDVIVFGGTHRLRRRG